MHGDDFIMLGGADQLDWFRDVTEKRLECKYRGRIGPVEDDKKEMRVLNRIATWAEERILYEGQQRTVEIGMRGLEVNEESSEA